MSNSYQLHQGSVPLLISMPHNGQEIPQDIASRMTSAAMEVPDTDWYIDRLYDFARAMGAYILMPRYNRYVIDLNRDPKGVNLYPGANSTELCPTTAFDLSDIYLAGQQPDEQEIAGRVEKYWQPYHQAIDNTLQELKKTYGKAVLLEAHSILSHVPRFFEGQLPDFNFGNGDGISCDAELLAQVQALDYSPYTMVTNGRFKGGFITRHYGQPASNIHALQLELSQITYMNEPSDQYNEEKAAQVKEKLKMLVQCLINFSRC
ncbi:N-formylglutamate deformylase [Thalassotalea insulae]|uniref:N-formylglutamate deformylase n=1 Tax=Thalassotalea insulae TaxID=2056778 RepID=A0ABQ6GU58_9GAMM|nr:N-formylglutamate deformylase [Thalassotalea insulae]GLX78226.1 N-formylglutamate deformylase [Thalassotalea insulae]